MVLVQNDLYLNLRSVPRLSVKLQWINVLNKVNCIWSVMREKLFYNRMSLFAIRTLKIEKFFEKNWCRGVACI